MDGWCRLETICYPLKYGTSSKSLKEGDVVVLRMGNIQQGIIDYTNLVFSNNKQDNEQYLLQKNDLLFNRTNSPELVGKTGIYKGEMPAIYAGYLIRIRTVSMNEDYLNYVMNSDYHRNYCQAVKTNGVSQSNINAEKIGHFLIPIPPYTEQSRIVKKIKKLAPFVLIYGRYKKETKLLGQEFPTQFKKSILQYAIQGKLVSQNPNDEPASELLKRIRIEKERLIKEKKIKRDKVDSVIFKGDDNKYYERIDNQTTCIDDDLPFSIPQNWTWVRLITICSYIQRGKSPKYSDIKRYPVIAQKCNQWDCLSLEKALFITPESLLKYTPERFIQDKDILMNSTGTGTIGRTGYYTENIKGSYECIVADSHITVIRCMKGIYQKYIYHYLRSPLIQDSIEENADGSTNQIELSMNTVKSYFIPLPPFSEQEKIVHQVEKLINKTII